MVNEINEDLAMKVAKNLGLKVPETIVQPINQAISADCNVEDFQPGKAKNYLDKSPALSQEKSKFDTIATRKIAFLMADGFSNSDFEKMSLLLKSKHAMYKVVAPHGGSIISDSGKSVPVDASISTTESVLYDAIYIPGGQKSIDGLKGEKKYVKFINEALKHCKAIAADKEGEDMLNKTFVSDFKDDKAILINADAQKFVDAIAKHRNWDRMERASDLPV